MGSPIGLSSILGVVSGHGQANFTVGNTVLDQYRTVYPSLALGASLDVRHVSTDSAVTKALAGTTGNGDYESWG